MEYIPLIEGEFVITEFGFLYQRKQGKWKLCKVTPFIDKRLDGREVSRPSVITLGENIWGKNEKQLGVLRFWLGIRIPSIPRLGHVYQVAFELMRRPYYAIIDIRGACRIQYLFLKLQEGERDSYQERFQVLLRRARRAFDHRLLMKRLFAAPFTRVYRGSWEVHIPDRVHCAWLFLHWRNEHGLGLPDELVERIGSFLPHSFLSHKS